MRWRKTCYTSSFPHSPPGKKIGFRFCFFLCQISRSSFPHVSFFSHLYEREKILLLKFKFFSFFFFHTSYRDSMLRQKRQERAEQLRKKVEMIKWRQVQAEDAASRLWKPWMTTATMVGVAALAVFMAYQKLSWTFYFFKIRTTLHDILRKVFICLLNGQKNDQNNSTRNKSVDWLIDRHRHAKSFNPQLYNRLIDWWPRYSKKMVLVKNQIVESLQSIANFFQRSAPRPQTFF